MKDKTKSTYTIKNGTKWIGDEAFMGCNQLTSITIPNSVIDVDSWAFCCEDWGVYTGSLTTIICNNKTYNYNGKVVGFKIVLANNKTINLQMWMEAQ